jgi:hypothetical protein
MGSGFAGLIGVVSLTVAIFLICRAIVLWYWRVNEGIALLKSIDRKAWPASGQRCCSTGASD